MTATTHPPDSDAELSPAEAIAAMEAAGQGFWQVQVYRIADLPLIIRAAERGLVEAVEALAAFGTIGQSIFERTPEKPWMCIGCGHPFYADAVEWPAAVAVLKPDVPGPTERCAVHAVCERCLNLDHAARGRALTEGLRQRVGMDLREINVHPATGNA